jgi:2-dehydro-3-deoxygluconokinase
LFRYEREDTKKMELRQNRKYDLIAPTSMGVRITPLFRQPVHTSDTFRMQATSAESNVLSIGAALGLTTKVLTAFVKDSPVARRIKDDLRRRGIGFEGPEIPQGGPWGFRHQFNIADSGFGARGPRVHNDRAGEAGRALSAGDFDVERIFGTEGVGILHLSGLVAALSPECTEFCLALARAAGKHGTKVSFDLNYRASFWKGREKELAAAFREIASAADVLIGNEEDFQLALGLAGPEAGGKGLAAKMEGFQAMIGAASERYPAEVFATTLREVISANEHVWGAILRAGGAWHRVEPRPIEVFDRIGGGDGFAGGLLYGILKGASDPAWTPEKWVRFGWACGALVVTLAEDFACPADEEQVWSVYEGNARVRR